MAKSRMTLHLMSTQMPHNCLTPAKVGTTSRPTTNISRQKSFVPIFMLVTAITQNDWHYDWGRGSSVG
jgi:hypothetical protein